jgi:hypothetical protein
MPGPEFSTPYIIVYFIFNDLGQEVLVHFVDIGGIVDHHCFTKCNFLLIIVQINKGVIKSSIDTLPFIIPSPTKLRRDIVMLPSVIP